MQEDEFSLGRDLDEMVAMMDRRSLKERLLQFLAAALLHKLPKKQNLPEQTRPSWSEPSELL